MFAKPNQSSLQRSPFTFYPPGEQGNCRDGPSQVYQIYRSSPARGPNPFSNSQIKNHEPRSESKRRGLVVKVTIVVKLLDRCWAADKENSCDARAVVLLPKEYNDEMAMKGGSPCSKLTIGRHRVVIHDPYSATSAKCLKRSEF